MVRLEQAEVTLPCVAVFAGDLLASSLAEYRCVVVVQVSVLGVPDIAILSEVLLSASVGELVPQGSVCGQPLEQTLAVPLTDRFRGVLVRALWSVAHVLYVGLLACERWDCWQAFGLWLYSEVTDSPTNKVVGFLPDLL